MNKKDTIRNYAIWSVLIVFYAVFYFVNNHAWVEELPTVSQKPSLLSSNKSTMLPALIPDTGSADSSLLSSTAPTQQRSILQSGSKASAPADPNTLKGKQESKTRQWTQQSIEINQASLKDWESLYNIGPYRAEKIVNFRTALGGFYNIDQVGETYALPDSVFREIKPYLTLESTWHRIRINHQTYDSLYLHPYVTKQMAYFIVRHRERQQPIRQMSELYVLIQEKDHERLRKLEPYLDFSIK